MSNIDFSLFQTLTSQISVKLITIIAVQATEIPWGIEHPENIFYEYMNYLKKLPIATIQQAPLLITSLKPEIKSSLV